MSVVVFDIGNVLVNWTPELAWADELGFDGARAFMDRVKFDKINLACDAGARFANAAAGIEDAEDAARLASYADRFHLTIAEKIEGSWDCLFDLKERGVPLHAITNWSAETWPVGLRVHPDLGEVFGTTIVSGDVRMIKPSVAIFELLCSRAGVAAHDCIFIDDGLHNCIGAKAAGMDAIHFTGPGALRESLLAKGVL